VNRNSACTFDYLLNVAEQHTDDDDDDISGAYTTHTFVCRMGLTSYDQIPEKFADYCYVEFTMPATQVSHTTVRSVSLSNGAKDEPPEKYVRYLARHEYRYEHFINTGIQNAYSHAMKCRYSPFNSLLHIS